MRFITEIDNQTYEIERLSENRLRVNGEELQFDVRQGSRPEHVSLIIAGRSYQIWMESGNGILRVHVGGFDFDVRVEDERVHRVRQLAAHEATTREMGQVSAPMPGLVVKILVEPGQAVQKGQGVAIVEAMKMENEIRAPIAGVVKEIRMQERQAVEKGEILAVIGE